MRPASFIGFFTATVFNPWLVNRLIPAQTYTDTQFWAVIGLDTILVIWSLFALKRIQISSLHNLLLSSCIGIWFVLGFSILDHWVGPRLLEHKKSLVYGAYDRARMVSTEFDLTYRMNNLGFRGPRAEIEKDERERIAFIGDSFTFGWGVEEEDSWLGMLRRAHPEKELLNLGRGGEHPMDHIQQARKILPVLKPDRLVVCLLSWNDLFQMKRVLDNERGKRTPSFESDSVAPSHFIYRAYRHLYPNFSSVFGGVVNIQNQWKAESLWILSQMNDEQKKRYSELSPAVKSAFEQFKLNPWILYEGLFHSKSYQDACSGEMEEALVRISHHLLEFEALAQENDCELTFLMLPYRPSNCPDCLKDLAGLGYEVSEANACFTESHIEKPLSDMITTPINLFNPSDYNAAEVHKWYFPLDGHLNETGNSVVAQWADTSLFR